MLCKCSLLWLGWFCGSANHSLHCAVWGDLNRSISDPLPWTQRRGVGGFLIPQSSSSVNGLRPCSPAPWSSEQHCWRWSADRLLADCIIPLHSVLCPPPLVCDAALYDEEVFLPLCCDPRYCLKTWNLGESSNPLCSSIHHTLVERFSVPRTVAYSCLDPGHSASGFVPCLPLGYLTAGSSLFSKWWHPSRMPKLGIFIMFAWLCYGREESIPCFRVY